ncbi:MAG: anthranilate synthase component I [Clostridium sp.]
MVNLLKEEFKGLRNEGKKFSFIEEFRGDELTPIRIFNSLSSKKKFIFESGVIDNKEGRYSFIGFDLKEDLSSKGYSLEKAYEKTEEDFLRETNPFPYKGGLVGVVSYDLLASYEKKLSFNNLDEIGTEDFRFYLFDDYICYDHFKSRVSIVRTIDKENGNNYEGLIEKNKKLYEAFFSCKNIKGDDYKQEEAEVECNYTKEEYLEKVEKAKEYIKKGDVFQVVFSQRFKCKTNKSGLEIYREIRECNPSPYMYYMNFEDYEIIGASPESLVSVIEGSVITNPIAGTRKRGVNSIDDLNIERELLEDEKERAEHLMLVDLGRNDVGRVSEIGTVEVLDFMQIERFSHVMHITSKVRGRLKKGLTSLEALISCIPAGTLSGAPKIRAMEIIEELENRKRGFYGGAVGYFSYGGNMDMAIAIRTLVLKNKIAYIQAGGGIVYDSVGELEYEETLNKSAFLREVVR